MPFKVYVYLSEDEISGKIAESLNELVGEVRSRAKVSSKNVWPAYTVVTVKIPFTSITGRQEEVEFEIWRALAGKYYEEGLKSIHGVNSIPAVKVGEKVFEAASALEIASTLRDILSAGTDIAFEKIYYALTSSALKIEEKEVKREAEAFTSSILKGAIAERIESLEKLLKEKKIDVETYRKMKRVYEDLMERG